MEIVDTLVSASWLCSNLGSDNLRLFSVTPKIESTSCEHITGADSFCVLELCDGDSQLDFTAPTEEQFSKFVSARGIDAESHVVLYEQSSELSMTLCRAWWTFKLFNHDKVSVLVGGLKAWKEANGKLSPEKSAYPATNYAPKRNSVLIRDYEQMVDLSKSGLCQIIDARGSDMYNAGHIPSATNVSFSSLLSDNKTPRDKTTVKDIFSSSGVDMNKPVVFYCGKALSACGAAMIFYDATGSPPVVYDGSWQEYSNKLPKE